MCCCQGLSGSTALHNWAITSTSPHEEEEIKAVPAPADGAAGLRQDPASLHPAQEQAAAGQQHQQQKRRGTPAREGGCGAAHIVALVVSCAAGQHSVWRAVRASGDGEHARRSRSFTRFKSLQHPQPLWRRGACAHTLRHPPILKPPPTTMQTTLQPHHQPPPTNGTPVGLTGWHARLLWPSSTPPRGRHS